MTNPQNLFAPARGAAFETWQLGLGRFPQWIFPPEGRPVRPLVSIYCNVDRRELGLVLGEDGGEPESALVERALRNAVREWRSKPARIEIAEPGLLPILTGLLAGTGVSVELGGDLSALRAAERDLQEKFSGTEGSPPGLLSGDGMTLAQISAFVQAAGDFFAAAPWRHFGLLDLLRIEAPDDIDPELRWLSFGTAHGKVLLSFFHNREGWEALFQEDFDPDGETETRWLLSLIPRWELPDSDSDLWDRRGLPTFGDDEVCPLPVCLSPRGVLRPDAHQLAFLEGLLRALAATGEPDIDTGRWEKRVATHLGPRRFILSFPGLLELVDDLTHLEDGEADVAGRIADLLDDAQELGGRRAVLLARKALALQPGSAEAHLALAEAAIDPAQAIELYSRALDLMDMPLDGTGPEEEDEDDLVDDLSPLLRVHAGLAKALTALGRREEALAHLFEIYRLDPGDLMEHQDRLAALLVELGRDGEAQALLNGNEGLSGPAYTLALLAFRRDGDSPAARRALRVAWRNNSRIPGALLPNSLPEPPDSAFSMESLEADDYVRAALSAWRATPGALTWLAGRSEDLSLAGRTSYVRKGKKAKGQRKKRKKRR